MDFFYLTTVKIMVYLKVCPFLSNSMCLFIHKTSFQRKKLDLVLWIVLVSLHLAEIMNNLNGEITACSSRFVAKKNKKIIYILCIINMLICSVESMIAISVAAFYISICFLNFQQTSVILYALRFLLVKVNIGVHGGALNTEKRNHLCQSIHKYF